MYISLLSAFFFFFFVHSSPSWPPGSTRYRNFIIRPCWGKPDGNIVVQTTWRWWRCEFAWWLLCPSNHHWNKVFSFFLIVRQAAGWSWVTQGSAIGLLTLLLVLYTRNWCRTPQILNKLPVRYRVLMTFSSVAVELCSRGQITRHISGFRRRCLLLIQRCLNLDMKAWLRGRSLCLNVGKKCFVRRVLSPQPTQSYPGTCQISMDIHSWNAARSARSIQGDNRVLVVRFESGEMSSLRLRDSSQSLLSANQRTFSIFFFVASKSITIITPCALSQWPGLR